jgi:hypothetical protein
MYIRKLKITMETAQTEYRIYNLVEKKNGIKTLNQSRT